MAVVSAFAVATIVVVFAVASIAKVRGLDAAGVDLANLLGINASQGRLVGLTLLTIEAAIAVAAAIPGLQRTALLAGAAVLGCFTIVLALAIARGQQTRCACFGPRSTSVIGPSHVVRNLLLVSIAVVGATTVDGADHQMGIGEFVLAAIPTAFTVGLVVYWDDIIDLIAPRPSTR